MTATEAIALREQRLRTDVEYRSQVEAVEAERAARAQALRAAERPIVEDLRAAGVEVASVWDLVNTAAPHPDALPVLLAHFERGGYPERVMESLGRALAVKPSVAYWEALAAAYRHPRCRGEEEGAAIALAACATRAQYGELVGFLSLPARGDPSRDTRIYFLRPIKRLGREAGRALLESLLDDPVFGREAAARLRVRAKW
jgi:hypothetical protein